MRYPREFLDELRSRLRLAELIGRRVKLVRRGREYAGLCPFHAERTPSFFVVEDEGFFHCFGCGAHGDAIGFVMRADNLDFEQAVEKVAGAERKTIPAPLSAAVERTEPIWVPMLPVPSNAPALLRPVGRHTVELVNPKHAGTPKERTSYRPVAWWAYRDGRGRLLGYVLRMEFLKRDGRRKKFTPQITFCAGPGGARRWCVLAFPAPRPLYGLRELVARPQAPVVLVEGEKAGDAGRRLLPEHVVVTWPGGSKAIAHVGWSALSGRDVFLLPDADASGRAAIDGWINSRGERQPGIAELLTPIAQRVRMVDPPMRLEDGWDLANAEAEGWSQADASGWLLQHLRPAAVDVSAAPIAEFPKLAQARARSSPLDRGRLAGLVRKIVHADEARLEGTLVWAAGVVAADAAPNGEIEPEFGAAVLASAAQCAGLPQIEVRRRIAAAFKKAELTKLHWGKSNDAGGERS